MDKERIEFFNKLSRLEKIHNNYEEIFKKIGIDVEGKDSLEVLTFIAEQLYDIQSRLYTLERK